MIIPDPNCALIFRVLNDPKVPALAAGIGFLITDYGETIAQFVQLVQLRGDDGLAAFASTLRPIKIVCFLAAFLSILAGLAVGRIVGSRA